MADVFKFAETFGNTRQPMKRRLATVVSVEAGHTCTVVAGADGTTYDGVRYFGHVSPKPGAQVWVESDGFDMVAIGAVAGFGGAAVAARVTKTANQSVANDSIDQITFPNPDFDPYNMWDNTNDRFVAPFDGVYQATACLTWDTNNTGYRAAILRKNGNNFSHQRAAAAAGASMYANVTGIIKLVKDDVVTLHGRQTSGGALNVLTDGDVTHFSLTYLGPAS